MTKVRAVALTAVAMLAFAANSVLCRLALQQEAIDAASFTVIRLLSGALALALLLGARGIPPARGGNWRSAFALFAYAAGFSFAYVSLPTGIGALLLFAAVQAMMILTGLVRGERLTMSQLVGLLFAFGGFVHLLSPGLSAPPLGGALLMVGAGIAWGVYSLRGRGIRDPLAATAGNFLRTVPMAIGLAMLGVGSVNIQSSGVLYAVLSGALASGSGYVVWYAALRGLSATGAATVQLSVPVIAALGGVLLLGEAVTMRLVLAAVAILGGVAIVLRGR
ncbi:DMT family transporter [Aromatoleum bremense]|uniref:EamA family transporter n=1 Tax=Aromatoleum bremense TaxID=76115 RepID=A0ABX1NUK7_9RHOO|nr:DMT family transporter [Aromatoleum bremense]NMG15593.1 EamA family transporter [Aromatoleum bremense]QTQ32885.1 EamA domain-containing protein [Aromatoleum bremense]